MIHLNSFSTQVYPYSIITHEFTLLFLPWPMSYVYFPKFFMFFSHLSLGHFWLLLRGLLTKSTHLATIYPNSTCIGHIFSYYISFTNIVSESVGFFTWHFWRIGIFIIFMATQFSHFNLLKKRHRNCWFWTMATSRLCLKCVWEITSTEATSIFRRERLSLLWLLNSQDQQAIWKKEMASKSAL